MFQTQTSLSHDFGLEKTAVQSYFVRLKDFAKLSIFREKSMNLAKNPFAWKYAPVPLWDTMYGAAWSCRNKVTIFLFFFNEVDLWDKLSRSSQILPSCSTYTVVQSCQVWLDEIFNSRIYECIMNISTIHKTSESEGSHS